MVRNVVCRTLFSVNDIITHHCYFKNISAGNWGNS